MSKQFVFQEMVLAAKPAKAEPAAVVNPQISVIWIVTFVGISLLLFGLFIFYRQLQWEKLKKQIRIEQFKSRELRKKLKLALETLHKIENNPDLVHSREVNLDYLRMRMSEDGFNRSMVNQIKVKVKNKIAQALRPHQAQQGVVGVASNGRQIDEIIDVEYETVGASKHEKRVLFRLQLRLMKLPTQATSATVSQIIECIQMYLSPAEDQDNWQPTIQGRIVYIHWDQHAKPTPMLVIEQSNEGVSISFRTTRHLLHEKPLFSSEETSATERSRIY